MSFAASLRDVASAGAMQADWSWTKTGNRKPFAKDRKAGTRAQESLISRRTNDYNNMFAPVSSGLRDVALGSFDQAAASDAGAQAGRTFDANVGAMEREQRGLGASQMAGQGERLGLRRVLAEVDAANRNYDAQDERRTMAQEASFDEYGSRMAAAGQIYGNIAEQEASRRAQHKQAKAAQRASIMQAVGTVASIAAIAV